MQEYGEELNIFVVSLDPKQAAIDLCNKHCAVMAKETTQLLSSALWLNGGVGPYKLTHKGHPCTKWVAESLDNWLWTYQHGIALCEEYTIRYKRTHACQSKIESMYDNKHIIPSKGLTPFALCMPDEYKCSNPVKSYRDYYRGAKAEIAVWPEGSIPGWWEEI